MAIKIFGLAERRTTIRTEVLAGLTTFMTMAYIVAVNPLILSEAGMPIAGVAAATCLAAGIGSILMGLIANVPLALAPGMGLNAYFTYTVVKGMGVPWETALGCVLISGLVFLALTVSGVRKVIVEAVPRPMFAAISAGIGLFIAFIGLKSAGLVVANPATTVTLGDLTAPTTLLALLGLGLTGFLMVRKVKAAVLIGIITVTGVAFATGTTHFTPQPYDLGAITQTAFKADVPAALGLGAAGLSFAVLEIIFVFLFVDFFDNLCTLVAVSKRAGLQAPDGTIPGLNRILLADSVATIAGATAGTSTVVSYVESAAGVEAGGRSGLTSVIVGLLFLGAFFLAPWVQLIPAAATAPALILVGGMMIAPLAETDWADPVIAIPAFLTLTLIPLTFSIATGLAFGLISYAVLKLLKEGFKRSDIALYVLAGLFIARFAWTTGG
jgi:AGZA family xanthine/uracil permease-like MFS transporter